MKMICSVVGLVHAAEAAPGPSHGNCCPGNYDNNNINNSRKDSNSDNNGTKCLNQR